MNGLPMRRVVWCLALSSLAWAAYAKDIRCDIESDYDMTVNERSVIFTRASGQPNAVVMRQGRLFVDDHWVRLDAGDTQRLIAFERTARTAMPLAQAVGREAANIAFTALGEVAASISNQPDTTRKSLDKARAAIDQSIARSISANRFSSQDLDKGIEQALKEVMPRVIGDVAGGALSAALSGDTERLKRMEGLEQQIQARVEPRAKALEARAQTLCEHMRELERLDNALVYRTANGQALNLLQTKPDQSHTSQH